MFLGGDVFDLMPEQQQQQVKMNPNNMYPSLEPSAPEMEHKSYQAPYPPPPAYSESVPLQQSFVPQPMPTSTTTTTIVNTVVVDSFPSKSIPMKCYHCNEDIKTRTEGKANLCTWLLCSLICFVGCGCGCCLIPFCTDGSRDILHYCPKCKKYLGSCERFRFRR